MTINNVAPQNVEGGNDQTVNEGDLVSLSGSFTDPGSADTHTFVWHVVASNGQTITNGTGQNFSFTPNDNGSYAVTFTVTDDDGGANSDNFTVTVDNVAPTATFNAPASVNEGSPINLSLSSPLDPSTVDTAAGFTYAFDCGSGYGSFSGTTSASCPTTDNGSRTVKGKIRDKDGGVNEYTASVTINNVAPQNVEGGNDQTVNEGDLVSLSGSFTDPGSADTHTFVWHVVASNGQTITNGTGQNFSFTPNDNGSYVVTFTVTDDDGGANSDNFTVTVDNVAPSITDVSVIPNPIDEGATTLVKITATDPGTADTLTYEFDCDNDLVYEISQSADEASCGYDDGTHDYAINVRVSDDDGGSDVEASSVHVNNVAPTATLSNDGPVDEGSPATITFSAASDPSSADTSAGFRYTFDCNGTDDLAASYAAADAHGQHDLHLRRQRHASPSTAASSTRTTATPSTRRSSPSTTWRPRTSRVAMTRPSTRAAWSA